MKILKTTLRIVTITLFIPILCAEHVFAFDLDMTVDDDIRKNYNSSKLVKDTNSDITEDLPELPDNLKNQKTSTTVKKTTKQTPEIQITHKGNTKIPKGISFNVVSTVNISDWQQKGTIVKFKTTSPIYRKKYTIPAFTNFTGEIVKSHQPQVSCNGGLVAIKIKSMNYNGATIPINAYITRADEKIIFLNNIKGERTYLKTVWEKGNWGRTIFNKMLTLTVNLGSDGSTLLLSPFPFTYGTICLGANAIISPVTAFFQKGKHVSIKSGSQFKIKLLDDAYIN